MKSNLGRTIAATIGALALVGSGLSGAFAAETTNPDFVASPVIASAETAEPVTGSIGFDQQVVALLDGSDYNVMYPVPAGATGVYTFVSPRGQESNIRAWNAKAVQGLTPGGILLPNVSLGNQATLGDGTPQGILAVRTAGGDYSLGLAFTKDNGVNLIPDSLYFGHITVTAGTGDWTYEAATVPPIPTTTMLTAPATGTAGTPVHVTATVAPAEATGAVEFREGATVLATDPAAPYEADLDLAAGSHSITAVYGGVAPYGPSTSAASTVDIAGQAVVTTVSDVTATSASGEGGKAVSYSATVAPAGATGTVTFTAIDTTDAAHTIPIGDATPDATTGIAVIPSASNVPAGSWTISAAFVGTGLYQPSAGTSSAPLVLTASSGLENPSAPDAQTVVVEVPRGAIVITTPYSTEALGLGALVLDQATSTYHLGSPVVFTSGVDTANSIQVVNTRPDHHAWSAFVESTPFTNTTAAGTFDAEWMSLIDVVPVSVQDNALQVTDITPHDIAALSSTPQEFATYAGDDLGTARLGAKLDIQGVPSSTPSGTYSAVLTFTAY